ncbi:hypothetical protein 8F9_6 [uncultured Caudovirales phage]|uniref:Uncharacterized protein n=1 Tax=uncultured Caudovirales phage TaxID=2100421 RepID=A0A2H4J5P2_9CAUD|nr:hypothetical protein [Pseudomonas sp. NBRC 111137]ASN69919.1 hypothetical protein 7AX6_47 [uncultured Caudovirales phage]ASN70679.1 hypothetical protein 2AX5_49 [uncultured Caudovirales phage]ASN70689.1 hypothetical protein 9AX3_6 [uncultured Caudovirales phage]ASN70751.1 hypothetical protein 10AX4_15 [uncultured Caudovirales phage]ASN70846.1 hypothetical protein 8S2_10 [uncultured Caudovirales phage]
MKTIAERLEELAIAYAKHRTAMWENQRAIKAIHDDQDAYVDLAPYRNRYYSGEVHDLILGECIVWHGWLHAVDTCREWDGDELVEIEDCSIRSMAALLDERKAIKSNGSQIRSRLRIIGQQLLKATPP